jgi:hypothetical protein
VCRGIEECRGCQRGLSIVLRRLIAILEVCSDFVDLEYREERCALFSVFVDLEDREERCAFTLREQQAVEMFCEKE